MRYEKLVIDGKHTVIERVGIDENGETYTYREVIIDKPIYFTKSKVYKVRLEPEGIELIGLLTESCGRIIERV